MTTDKSNETDKVIEGHEYDGIKELNNGMPPILKYIFYATLIFAAIYVYKFHVAGGPDQYEDYDKAMTVGAKKKNASVAFDKKNIVLLTESKDIEAGKEKYTQLCAICHGVEGQGTIGPNLTDEYWKNGGNIKDIFESVENGRGEGTMPPFKSMLSTYQISQISSFIKSLKGSNPPNGKAPEGDLYEGN